SITAPLPLTARTCSSQLIAIPCRSWGTGWAPQARFFPAGSSVVSPDFSRARRSRRLVTRPLGCGGPTTSAGPLPPVGDTPIGVRRADYVGGSIFPLESEQSVNHFFNPAAFQTAPDG